MFIPLLEDRVGNPAIDLAAYTSDMKDGDRTYTIACDLCEGFLQNVMDNPNTFCNLKQARCEIVTVDKQPKYLCILMRFDLNKAVELRSCCPYCFRYDFRLSFNRISAWTRAMDSDIKFRATDVAKRLLAPHTKSLAIYAQMALIRKASDKLFKRRRCPNGQKWRLTENERIMSYQIYAVTLILGTPIPFDYSKYGVSSEDDRRRMWNTLVLHAYDMSRSDAFRMFPFDVRIKLRSEILLFGNAGGMTRARAQQIYDSNDKTLYLIVRKSRATGRILA